jgi:pyrroline-5-carboxylate reductase
MSGMEHSSDARIGFVGGGHMARALIGGLLQQGIAADRLCVGEPEAGAREALEHEFKVRTSADNRVAVDGAAVVVLAVKPQVVATVLGSLRPSWPAVPPLLLSIVAGLRIADLAAFCPSLPIVRAMPNRPALIGAGVTALYAPPSVSAAQRPLAERVVAAAGRFLWLRAETDLDVVTALSGSGPAYFFLLAEQLARAATALGLDPGTATVLATETLYGSGLLARGTGSLAEQRAAVTSRGGTTQAALEFLAAGGFDNLVAGALRAAATRSVELADLAANSLRPPGIA